MVMKGIPGRGTVILNTRSFMPIALSNTPTKLSRLSSTRSSSGSSMLLLTFYIWMRSEIEHPGSRSCRSYCSMDPQISTRFLPT